MSALGAFPKRSTSMDGPGFDLLLEKWTLRTFGGDVRVGVGALSAVGGGEDPFRRDGRAGALLRGAVRGVVGACLDEGGASINRHVRCRGERGDFHYPVEAWRFQIRCANNSTIGFFPVS